MTKEINKKRKLRHLEHFRNLCVRAMEGFQVSKKNAGHQDRFDQGYLANEITKQLANTPKGRATMQLIINDNLEGSVL